ncbi:MAG: purine-nucleoside phosphorylase [Candidatus Melainabacteria bacterium]
MPTALNADQDLAGAAPRWLAWLEETVPAVRKRLPAGVNGVHAGVVLGSGLGDFAATLRQAVTIPYPEIPHFRASHVAGHAGNLVLGEVKPGYWVACFQGRFHYYEGHPMDVVTYPIRVLAALGAQSLVVTNAAGGIHPGLAAGSLMMITDHINLMGVNPLRGPHAEGHGERFPDMSQAYAPALQQTLLNAAEALSIRLHPGVYAAVSGPSYETPAEIRMLKTLGADAVGMSTVPEVIVANQLGLGVVGLSCVSNAAAGLSDRPVTHEEVMQVTRAGQQQVVSLLQSFFEKLGPAS